ncbi:MAG: hypothetical protein WCI43_09530, partial [Candidatus Firestonebacteria bacterium]
MRQFLAVIFLLLPLFAAGQAMEEKKEREPVFVLPDVVITGEVDTRVGGEKKDLLPENYPVPPKETPMMELQFIKGPYLEDDKNTPQLEEKAGDKARLGELVLSYGSFSSKYGRLMYGDRIDKLNYLLRIEKDIRNYDVTDNGYSNSAFSADLNYSMENALDLSLSLSYSDETRWRTSPLLAYTAEEDKRRFYSAVLRGRTPGNGDAGLFGSVSLGKSMLDRGAGFTDDSAEIMVGGNFFVTAEATRIFSEVSLNLKTDPIYGQLFFLSVEGKFKLDALSISAGLKYDQLKLNPSAEVLYEVDGSTHLYASFKPRFIYPDFKKIYSGNLTALNAGLAPENLYAVITTGIEHRILKDMPVVFELFRKESENFITYETRSDMLLPVNIAKATLVGLNFSEQWALSPGITQRLKYVFVNAVNGDPVKNIPYVAQHSLRLEGEFADSGWELTAGLEYTGEMYCRADLQDKIP